MNKLALIAALPVALSLAACGESADDGNAGSRRHRNADVSGTPSFRGIRASGFRLTRTHPTLKARPRMAGLFVFANGHPAFSRPRQLVTGICRS